MHRNLILAGNFNLTNVNELFDNLVDLRSASKREGRYRYSDGENRTLFR